MNIVEFAISVTGPIFLVVLLGFGIRRAGMIDANFVQTASLLVFRIGLPAILFLGVYKGGGDASDTLWLSVLMIAMTLLLVAASWLYAHLARLPSGDVRVFVQGVYRANLGIIALAFCANTFGIEGLAQASVPMGILTVLYNLIAVLMFDGDSHGERRRSGVSMVLSVLRNPLIIAILAGFAYRATGLPLPSLIEDTGEYFAGMTLPLALLCIGASLDPGALRSMRGAVTAACMFKLVLAPLLFTLAGLLAGWRGQSLGILFFFGAAPTAAASFIMVKAVRGNESLAAGIVAFSTVGSLVTVTAGVLILKAAGLI